MKTEKCSGGQCNVPHNMLRHGEGTENSTENETVELLARLMETYLSAQADAYSDCTPVSKRSSLETDGLLRFSNNHQSNAEKGGNWRCINCMNVNFPYRVKCNNCQQQRGIEGEWSPMCEGMQISDNVLSAAFAASPRSYTGELGMQESCSGNCDAFGVNFPSRNNCLLTPTSTIVSSGRSPVHCDSNTVTPTNACGGGEAFGLTTLQIVLLKSKDVVDKLRNDFDGLGYNDVTDKVCEVLKLSLGLLGQGEAFEECTTPSNSLVLPGVGGPHFAAPTMLAHPDEFKNPSSFLKIYGDPLCGVSSSPMKGSNGNWECPSCKNLNFPRRFRCNRCPATRDSEGDRIVHDYASRVYYQHLKAYRKVASNSVMKPSEISKAYDRKSATPTHSKLSH